MKFVTYFNMRRGGHCVYLKQQFGGKYVSGPFTKEEADKKCELLNGCDKPKDSSK